MSKILEKFMSRLVNKGQALPPDINPSDIANISFQPMLGVDKYTVNVWFKAHTGIPNQTTYKYQHLTIDGCLKLKQEIETVLVATDDELFSDNDISSLVSEEKKETEEIEPPDSFFATPLN